MILVLNKNHQTTNIMFIIIRHNNSDLQFSSIKPLNSQFLRACIPLDNKMGFT